MALTLLSFKTMADLIDGLRDVPKGTSDIGLIFQAAEEAETENEGEAAPAEVEQEMSPGDMAEDATEYMPPEEEMS